MCLMVLKTDWTKNPKLVLGHRLRDSLFLNHIFSTSAFKLLVHYNYVGFVTDQYYLLTAFSKV